MRLDLNHDSAVIYDYLADRIRCFQPHANDGPGEPDFVKMIEVGYELSQSGWVVAIFDTRPDAAPDGEWTSHIDGNCLGMPHWVKAGEAQSEGPITLVLPGGSEKIFSMDEELAIPIGEMIKGVLLKAKADGLFQSLPKADACEFGVEHFDGGYGWPEYERRHLDGLVG